MKKFFRKELILAGRFGLIGITATLTHMTTVWLLVSSYPIPVLIANIISFFIAFGISFTGNYYWTFRSPGSPRKALLRFFVISGSAFVTNMFLLSWLLYREYFSPATAAITAAGIIPVFTFFLSRFWGFRNQE